MEYCCDRFKEAVTLERTIERAEWNNTLEWVVPGCCGGGCYVLRLEYCPYCGKQLPAEEPTAC